MPKEQITTEVSDRICNHMNKDHPNALISYARYYAGLSAVKTVRMTKINLTGMEIEADGSFIQIPFDHKLIDSEDAHQTLVAMLKAIPKKD